MGVSKSMSSNTGPTESPPEESPPPYINTAAGLAKVVLGFAAGIVLLFMVVQSFRTDASLNLRLVYLLAAFLVAFLGVDVLKIIQGLSGRK